MPNLCDFPPWPPLHICGSDKYNVFRMPIHANTSHKMDLYLFNLCTFFYICSVFHGSFWFSQHVGLYFRSDFVLLSVMEGCLLCRNRSSFSVDCGHNIGKVRQWWVVYLIFGAYNRGRYIQHQLVSHLVRRMKIKHWINCPTWPQYLPEWSGHEVHFFVFVFWGWTMHRDRHVSAPRSSLIVEITSGPEYSE